MVIGYLLSVTFIYKTGELERESTCAKIAHVNNRMTCIFCTLMDRNGILYVEDGRKRIVDNTLVALTLMIAEIRTGEKDVMVKVMMNLINKENRQLYSCVSFRKT